MYYHRKGYPEVDEIVLCQVTKIFPNSVFVDILEYKKSGMVHISEIAPGRIRNLRDFVSEGRQIVCKVLKIDEQKGYIDLSLRRVNTTERRNKLEEVKQEQKAEGIIKNLATKLKLNAEQLYEKISEKVFKDYDYVFPCFKAVAAGEADLEKMGVEKKIAQELSTIIIEKFKPQKITIEGEIALKTYAPNGIEKIKATLLSVEKAAANVIVFYLGGGRYKLVIEDVDYEPAEKSFLAIEKLMEEFNDKLSTATVERIKKE